MFLKLFSPNVRRWFQVTVEDSSERTVLTLEHPAWRLGTLVGCGIGSLAFALGYVAEAPDAGTPDRMVYAFGTLVMLLFALLLWRWSGSIRTLATIVIGGSGAFFVYRLVYMLYFAPPGVDVPKEMTESLFWVPVVHLLGYLMPGLTLGRRLALSVNLLMLMVSALYLTTPFKRDVAFALAQLNLANWTFAYAVRSLSVYKELMVKAQSEREVMARLATTDALTGIANRLAFERTLETQLATGERTGETFALVFVDLDHFKAVNDTYGHTIGDELLVAVAGRLRHAVRHGDTLARLSGDEFVVLLREIRSAAEAARIAETLLGRFETPFKLSGMVLGVRASVGFSVYPDDGTSATELLQMADKAMYWVKAQQRAAVGLEAPKAPSQPSPPYESR